MQSVGDRLRAQAEAIGDRPFVWSGTHRRTFGEMDDAATRAAAGLSAHGVRAGDRVAVISGNRIEMVELFFACARLGAVFVPLNVFLKGDFLRFQLADSRASTLVADGPGAASVAGLLGELPELTRVVTLDDGSPDAAQPSVSYAELTATGATVPAAEPAAESLLSILYTSGTTGMPKGCMLPHGWYLNGSAVSSRMVEYREDDVPLTCLPLFHAWAQGTVMGALVHGLQAVVDPVFSVGSLRERFVETGATVFLGVGAMGMALLATPPSELDRAGRLRVALMIPFGVQDQVRFQERFGARVLSQLYGQTETGAIAYSALSEGVDPASVGRPAPYLDVAVVDEDDVPVAPGEVGEVVVRPRVPAAIYLGYWDNPEATLDAWRNLWHHTGDYGRMSDEGVLTFVDRKKDVLRRRGENVSSVELERAIAAHPAIAEAAVHAVPSPMTEDDIKACLVLTPGARVDPNELFVFFRDALPYFAVPRYVEVLPELPKTATLRVMKHVLRERGITEATWDLEALGLTVAKTERR
ncbi:MAG: AMP-binding protein [Actinobacteria bacterium]|nr:AMP-binding protein [Actinomycetota bacterium]